MRKVLHAGYTSLGQFGHDGAIDSDTQEEAQGIIVGINCFSQGVLSTHGRV